MKIKPLAHMPTISFKKKSINVHKIIYFHMLFLSIFSIYFVIF